jgi:GMP synthase - Glutamine amidotransferase domain
MILLVDLSDAAHPLSRDEFVHPLARIVRRCGRYPIIRHHTTLTKEDRKATDGIILCGTALQDNGFLRHSRRFQWLREEKIPVLGVCAGMQILVTVFGGTVRAGGEIGMTPIRVLHTDPLLEGKEEFPAYELHAYSPEPPEDLQILAVSSLHPQVIRHRSRCMYGVLFHPEVRNEWVIERFLTLCGKGMV